MKLIVKGFFLLVVMISLFVKDIKQDLLSCLLVWCKLYSGHSLHKNMIVETEDNKYLLIVETEDKDMLFLYARFKTRAF